MARKPHLQLTITSEVAKDLHSRGDTFNASAFFENRYRLEFLNTSAIERRITVLEKEKAYLELSLKQIKEGMVVTPPADERRCPLCRSFFKEDLSFRRRVNIYKTHNVCQQCFDQHHEEVDVYKISLLEKEKTEEIPCQTTTTI